MILVADSGGSKCDWLIYNQEVEFACSSPGINPLFTSSDQIVNIISNSDLMPYQNRIDEVFFYGAACSNEINNAIVINGLSKVFPQAKITVNHDLLAAARASCGNEAGFCAILGTGSNLCFYDGSETITKTPSLGYILGDEGSGAHLGKQLIKAYLYHQLPKELANSFNESYGAEQHGIIHNLYKSDKPNRYLASFAVFLKEHSHHPYIHQLIYEAFASFCSIHLWKYEDFRVHPVNFVGSIAYYFQDILQEVAINHRFTAGKFIKQPIEQLAKFHQQNT